MLIQNIRLLEDRDTAVITAAGNDFYISLKDFARLRLYDGKTLTEEEAEELEYCAERIKCMKKALYLISMHNYSEKALILKLREKYRREICLEVVKKLIDTGYVDEGYAAARLAELMAEKKYYGGFRIKAELLKKGFKPESIKDALEAEAFSEEAQAERAKAAAQKYAVKFSGEALSQKEQQALYGYLYRLGYTSAVIRNAVAEYADDENI